MLVREAAKNVLSSRRRLRPLLLIAIVLGVFITAVMVAESQSFKASSDKLYDAGSHVVIFEGTSSSPATINRQSCDDLARNPGVVASGAIIASTRQPVQTVGRQAAISTLTGNLIPELERSSVVIGSEVPFKGSWLLLEDTRAHVVRAARQPEGVPLNQSIVQRAPTTVTSVDQCIAVLDRRAPADSMRHVLLAQLRVDGGPVAASTVAKATLDPVESYLTRLSAWLPPLAGVLGAILSIGAGLTRSDEIAAYRMSGSNATHVLVILSAESALTAGALAMSGTASTLLLAPYLVDVTSAIAAVVLAGTCWVGLAYLGLALAAHRRLDALGKER